MEPILGSLLFAILAVIILDAFRFLADSIDYVVDEIKYRIYDRKRKKKEYLERIRNLTDKLND